MINDLLKKLLKLTIGLCAMIAGMWGLVHSLTTGKPRKGKK